MNRANLDSDVENQAHELLDEQEAMEYAIEVQTVTKREKKQAIKRCILGFVISATITYLIGHFFVTFESFTWAEIVCLLSGLVSVAAIMALNTAIDIPTDIDTCSRNVLPLTKFQWEGVEEMAAVNKAVREQLRQWFKEGDTPVLRHRDFVYLLELQFKTRKQELDVHIDNIKILVNQEP